MQMNVHVCVFKCISNISFSGWYDIPKSKGVYGHTHAGSITMYDHFSPWLYPSPNCTPV